MPLLDHFVTRVQQTLRLHHKDRSRMRCPNQ